MKKILIALDYDPTAKKVAEVGFAFVKDLEAEVTLLHVIADEFYYSSTMYDPIMGFYGYTNLEFLDKQTNKSLHESTQLYLDKIKVHLNGNNIRTFVAQGDAATAVVETAITIKADLIIMGSHSRRWLEKIVLGSVTEKVLNETLIPLLIIPTKK